MVMIRVAAIVVDTELVEIYQEDGTKMVLQQGDQRIRPLIDKAMPIIQAGGIAELDLDASENNAYRDFEEKTNGFVKFFRVAKSKLKAFFGEDEQPVAPTGTFGSIPVNEPVPEPAPKTQPAEAVDEILSQATPVSDPSFVQEQTSSDHTIVAHVDGKIIPGVEQLKGQFKHAVNGSEKGLANFMKRLSGMIEKRGHSVEDILRFMERGDLPVADDGSIIAYKRLYRQGERFVDPHTRKVTQRVGSFVCVDESLVDKNRRNECSSGLHIGRRAYMGGFSGDSLFLCKVAPEDVIVVPHGDPNKVRVCGYHILFELTGKAKEQVLGNRPMTTSPEASAILGKAIAGDHIHRIEEVRITQSNGGGLKITALGRDGKPKPVESKPAHALDDTAASKTDPKHVASEAAKAAPAPTPKAPVAAKPVPAPAAKTESKSTVNNVLKKADQVQAKSRNEIVAGYIATMNDPNLNSKVRAKAANDAQALKKSAKVSWEKLGQPSDMSDTISKLLAKLSVNTAVVTKTEPAKSGTKAPEAKPKVTKESNQQPVKAEPQVLTRVERARKFFNDKDIKGLKAFKQKSKVSWTQLGFNQKEVATILKG